MSDAIVKSIILEYASRIHGLYEVADFIEAIPDAEFRIDHWWLNDGMAFDDERNRMYRVADGPCGCPIGHLVQKCLFGLTPELFKEDRQRIFVIVGDTFGVNYKLAEFMFDQYSYGGSPTKEAVASRVRFVADEQCASI